MTTSTPIVSVMEITTVHHDGVTTITAVWRPRRLCLELLGMPIEIDDTLPPDTIEIRGPHGAVRFELPPESATPPSRP